MSYNPYIIVRHIWPCLCFACDDERQQAHDTNPAAGSQHQFNAVVQNKLSNGRITRNRWNPRHDDVEHVLNERATMRSDELSEGGSFFRTTLAMKAYEGRERARLVGALEVY